MNRGIVGAGIVILPLHSWRERPVALASSATSVVLKTYDFMGRRVVKVIGTTQWWVAHDGWQENIPDPLYYAGDANGNITDVMNTNGTLAAHYEYDPFGNTIAQSGDLADANPFRFSSKYWDAEVGVYYYGFRFYSPELGRWPNRDPIEEEGGENLYGFIDNSPCNEIDPLGLSASCSTQTTRLRTKRLRQTTSRHVLGQYAVADYRQYTELVTIIVSSGGFITVERPTHYTCKCVCMKRQVERRRTVTCTKYRETTTCTGPCTTGNPIVSTRDYWGPPQYGSATTHNIGRPYDRTSADASGTGAMSYLGCAAKCAAICAAGFGSPSDFEDVTCSD